MPLDSLENDRRKEENERRQQAARRAATHEPAPTGNGEIILDSAVAVVNRYALRARSKGNPSLHDEHLLVVEALKARAEMGKAKYGTYLRARNGRNALNDLYQELLDAIMYSEQCRNEALFLAFPEENVDNQIVGAGVLESLVELAVRVASQLAKAV
jgi:hypothetical protein